MSDTTVRPATAADYPALDGTYLACWREAYDGILPESVFDAMEARAAATNTRFGEVLEQRGAQLFVAAHPDGLRGFAATAPSRDTDATPTTGEVLAIYVRAAAWGQGVGAALMNASLSALRQGGMTEATLWVLEDNPRAHAFYRGGGWIPDGAAKDELIYGTPVKEVRLRRQVP